MNLIKKALLFYKREGLYNTLIRTVQKIGEQIRRVPGDIVESIFSQYYRKRIAEHVKGKQVYIVISCIDWNIPIFQRPHQLATALSHKENAHVLFISEKQRYDYFSGMFLVNPNLDIVSERLTKVLYDSLQSAVQVTVFKTWPRRAEILEQIPYDALVYEYIDDFSLFYYYTEDLKQKHYDLMRKADLVVCTAKVLYEDALRITSKAIFSPNAGDYVFFHSNRNCPIFPALLEKTQKYECVLGYYGCLARWFDYALVLNIARKMPQWCFVFVGYCFDGTISQLQEAGLQNIILYPAQPYGNLPSFISAFDIQIIPFVINDITTATSPVKLYEYMASGKPILTSNLPECQRYQSVVTYLDGNDFIKKVSSLMTNRNNPEYIAVMDKEARENTWDARVTEILTSLRKDDFTCVVEN